MVVSSSLLILALGIFSGMIEDMLASATEQYHGHLVVSAEGYQEDRDLFSTLEPTPELIGRLAKQETVNGVSPRLRSFGLLSAGQSSHPVELLGVQPEHERTVTTLQDKLVAGRYLPEGSGNGALLGKGLAERLGAGIGAELVFLTQAADGSIGNDLLTVTGIFATGDSGHDNGLALVDLEWLQGLVILPGQAHEIALHIDDPLTAPQLAATMKRQLPPDLEAIDWGQLMPEMNEAIATYDVSRMIIIVILYVATGLGILNTFFMSVMERTREFGILMAMGLRPWRIRALVLLEAVLLGVLSLIVGVGLGAALTLYMREVGIDLSGYITPITYAGGTILPRLTAVFDPANFWLPATLLLIICLLSAFFPANRAAGLQPVEAIREQ
ncbi:MAG: ABC transporter permease [Desulfuromonadales bacterium]|nr:ABC transporter permease [Desulfuromonadales bacterium]NIR33451.1 ABC transporter permease [Desulfuromonadales bacterium]NIS42209.1 ABC transporter permease [Desulfuromonadales bacterium]